MSTAVQDLPAYSKPHIEKDSRRSWYVCLGTFIVVGFSFGINNSFGVLFVFLVDEFRESKTKIAWIGSFAFIWYMFTSPAGSYLNRCYGYRRVVFAGNFLLCLGVLASSFAKEAAVLYVTYGLLFGSGMSLLCMSSITVMPLCFEKHLATANGIMSSAVGFCTLWVGPMYEYLIRFYGWRTAGRLLIICIVPLAVGCALFPKKNQIPMEEQEGTVKKNIGFSLTRILRNKAFMTWILSMILTYLGLYVPHVHLISFSKDISIATDVSVYSISCLCAFETMGKMVFGKLLDFFHWSVYTINSISLLVLAVSITLLPLASTVVHLFLFASFYGFALGVQCLALLIITPQVCHPADSKQAVAYLFTALSIPGGVGPAVAAWIYDSTRSYHAAFFIAGALYAIASCLGVFLPALVDSEDFRDVVTTKNEAEFKFSKTVQSPVGNHSGRELDGHKTVLEYVTVV